MLRENDVERLLEAADELGFDYDEKDVQDLWCRYEKQKGEGALELPVDFASLCTIVRDMSVNSVQ